MARRLHIPDPDQPRGRFLMQQLQSTHSFAPFCSDDLNPIQPSSQSEMSGRPYGRDAVFSSNYLINGLEWDLTMACSTQNCRVSDIPDDTTDNVQIPDNCIYKYSSTSRPKVSFTLNLFRLTAFVV
jgi:hypothetical protein